MVGREVDTTYRTKFCDKPGDVLVEVRGLHSRNGVKNIDLALRAGEIVGLAGLVGSGRTELARAIFGADAVSHGEVLVKGTLLKGGPVAAVRRGIGFVPENRKMEGPP
jgi:ribose transport system ATP-binding protein